MPNQIAQLTTHTLKAIHICRSHHELKHILGKDYSPILEEMPYALNLKRKRGISIASFMEAVETAEIPVEILWITVGFISLGVATFWIVGSVGFFAIALFLGVFYHGSKKQQEKSVQEENNLELTEIKVHALDELLRRSNSKNLKLNFPEEKQIVTQVNYKKSFSLTISLILALGITYWGITDILLTVGLISATSLLVSPIGLGIAFGVAILIGAGLAIYHHYQQKNNWVKSATKILDTKYTKQQAYLDILEQTQNHLPETTSINTQENNVIPFKKMGYSPFRFFQTVPPKSDAEMTGQIKLRRSQSF